MSAFDRYGKPFLILLVIALVIWLAAISMAVLVPFLIGILLAYLLVPLVNWLERVIPPRRKAKKSKRVIAVVIVFIVFTVVMIFFTAYIGAALITASGILINKAPDFISQCIDQFGRWWSVFKVSLPPDIDARINSTLAEMGPGAAKFAQDFLTSSVAVIPASMPTIIGFITLPFFLIFVLIDYEKFGKYYNQIFTSPAAQHTAKMLAIFGNQMGRYIRFQVIMGLTSGFFVTIGLLIIGGEYAPALGVVTGFTQVIPIIGPFISAAVILMVTLALKPNILWGAIVVIVLTQLIVNLMQGWVQEKHFPLHPAVVMVVMAIGGYIASYWGLILALPVSATVWAIYKYFRGELKVEEIVNESS